MTSGRPLLILVLLSAVVFPTNGFCVENRSCRRIEAKFPNGHGLLHLSDFSKTLAASNGGKQIIECCNPTSSGCYQSDDNEFQLRINCDKDGEGIFQSVQGCKECKFVVENSGIIVVTKEKTGMFVAAAACKTKISSSSHHNYL